MSTQTIIRVLWMLLAAATVGLLVAAIWTTAPVGGRLAATGGITFLIAICLATWAEGRQP